MAWNEDERKRIASLIATAQINTDVTWWKKNIIPKIVNNKSRYKAVADALGIPLAMIPCIHLQERASDLGLFKAYLGNGQPLTQKTTIVPKGRGPFNSWEEGARDALILDGMNKIGLEAFTLERMLYELEGYNGYGYRSKGINSPYIWNFTNLYTKGRYVKDGVFDPNAKSANIGCYGLYILLCEADPSFKIGAKSPEVITEPLPAEIETPDWFEPFKVWIMAMFEKLFGSKPTTEPKALPDPTGDKLELIVTKNPNIEARAVAAALKWYDNAKVTNKSKLIVVDFNKFDYEDRFHLIDMATGEAKNYLCAHGSKSDANKDQKPDAFSNVEGSNMSSLGAMVIAEKYASSKFKFARRIDGLEPSLNGNVRKRAVVWHSSLYVTQLRKKNKTVGDSLGCFAMDEADAAKLVDTIGGCLIYAWDDSLKV